MKPGIRGAPVARPDAARLLTLLLLASLGATGAVLAPEPIRIVVGGVGGWDYLTLDDRRHHLFITRGDRVQVFDTRTHRIVTEIPDTDGVHGVALAQDRALGFTSNGKSNSVTVFDLDSLKTLGQIAGVGSGPDSIVFDAGTARVFTFNARSNDATAIDVGSRQIVATIPLGGRPEFAASDGRGTLFVNIEDKNLVERIDATVGKVTGRWTMGDCQEPSGLTLDSLHRRLFSVCANKILVVLDADTGRIVAQLPIGSSPDAVAYMPESSLILSSNGEGTVSVMHQDSPDDYSVVMTARTHPGARTVAVDAPQRRAYLVSSDFEAASPAAAASAPRRRTQVPGTFSVFVLDFSTLH